MVRRISKKNIDRELWKTRLDKALLFQKQAQNNFELLEHGEDATGVSSDVILSAIAFGDALTIKALGKINKDDRAGLPDLVKQALPLQGNKSPNPTKLSWE